MLVRFVDMDGDNGISEYPVLEVQVTKDHLWAVMYGRRECLAHYVEVDDADTDSGNRDGWHVDTGTLEGRVFSDFLVINSAGGA